MQDVVLEILKIFIGRFGAFQIEIDMFEKQALPVVRLIAFHVAKGIHGQSVMAAIGFGGVDDFEQHRHGGVLCFLVNPILKGLNRLQTLPL
jgi:hypothetical protein